MSVLLFASIPGQAKEKPQAVAAQCDKRCVHVEVTPVRQQIFAPEITLTGAIEAKFHNNTAFRVSGKIAKRLAEVGDHVAADQTLATIDPRDQAANLDTAKAGLDSARALLAEANMTFERQKDLYAKGYSTRPAFDRAQQDVRTQQAAVKSAEAAVGTAEEQVGYTQLKAGTAGIVTARDAEVGQVVQAGQTSYTIAQDGPRDAVFAVYEVLLTDSPAKKVIRVALRADPSVAASGRVREVSPSVDPKSGTVQVKVALDALPSGMALGASVVGTGAFKPSKALVLPRDALSGWNGAPAVWVLDPAANRVAPKVVEIERYSGDLLVLSSGVEPDQLVVTAGTQFLHPGQVVVVAKAGRT